MALKTAEAFVERIPNFIGFIVETGLNDKLTINNSKTPIDHDHPLFGKTIVMTGFRDNAIQDFIKSVGGKLGTSVSKQTFLVLVKDLNEETGKVLDAKKLGINILTSDEFNKKYL